MKIRRPTRNYTKFSLFHIKRKIIERIKLIVFMMMRDFDLENSSPLEIITTK